jgi:dolichol-phosphate mannosyltransferase
MDLTLPADTTILVVIPTYNEADNIARLMPALLGLAAGIEILVVDDNSPDATAAVVKEMARIDGRVHLLERPGKMGLGSAYVLGFKYALEHHYTYILQMDADFSHDPHEIPNFLAAARNADLVLGSRYANGVRVLNWPIHRLLLSYFANVYSRIMTGLPVTDATGGFKCFRRAVLESINLNTIRSNGYAFQIEMTYKAWKKGFRVEEIPITFLDRRHGSSKMSKQIVHEALFMLFRLRVRAWLNRL